jgi:glycosyltransferase involved in cell wall biosynthesis
MQKDLVSVIMPTYNDAKYLPEAIDDILTQTYENFELIIVNDGSTDNTSEILESYALKDKRISVYEKENGGTGSALNYGFKRAKGEFGTWASSDDNKQKEFIDTLVQFLKKNRDVEFVCSAFRSAYLKKNVRAYVPLEDGAIIPHNISQQDSHDGICTNQSFIVDNWCELNYQSCMLGVCFMYTMRLRKAIGEDLEIPGEDYHMAIRLGMNSRVGYVDTVLGTHNNPPDSLSMSDRACTADANVISRTLVAKTKRWNLPKIPKVASFYWGSDKMSFMRYLTIYSFKKMNPDWSVHLYVPKTVSNQIDWRTAGGDNLHSCDQIDYDGEDYYNKLIEEVPLKTIKVDFSKTFLSQDAPEPHKSDLLTWQILATKGGLWCDMDVLFIKPMTDLEANSFKEIDTVLCYDVRNLQGDGTPEKPIGFLMSKKNNVFFKKALIESKKHYVKNSYQSIGAQTIHRVSPTFEMCKSKFYVNKTHNLNVNSVYYLDHTQIDKIYNIDVSDSLPEDVIGIHWYGGHPLSQEFNNRVDSSNYKNENNTLGSLIKKVLD